MVLKRSSRGNISAIKCPPLDIDFSLSLYIYIYAAISEYISLNFLSGKVVIGFHVERDRRLTIMCRSLSRNAKRNCILILKECAI